MRRRRCFRCGRKVHRHPCQGKLLTADAPAHVKRDRCGLRDRLGEDFAQPCTRRDSEYAAPILALAALKVTMDGTAVDPGLIKYAGLTPGSAGLYQINLEITGGYRKRPGDPGRGGQLTHATGLNWHSADTEQLSPGVWR